MHRPWLPLLLAAVSAWPALPAHANHESAPAILNQFRVLGPRLHVLKPAPSVRALPVSTDEAARQRIDSVLTPQQREQWRSRLERDDD